MKFYKNWPYWLKGGIIFELVVAILFLCSSFVVNINSNVNSIGFLYSIAFFIVLCIFAPGILLVFPLSQKCFLDGFFGSQGCPISHSNYWLIIFIINILFYFMLGVLVSWLIRKFKNRNKLS